MTFSKIKLFGFLALSCSLIACGQTPVSTAPNASPNAIAQTTTAPQPAETPAVVAKSPEPQSSVTQVPEKSPEPQSSAVASTKVETAIAQSQDASTKTTIAQQTTEPIGGGMQMGILYRVYMEEKQDLGGNRWRFRTRTEYSKGKDRYSPWRTADCGESSIDGEIITAIARSRAEEGGERLLRAVCGLPK
jgi:hypothetical protein